MNLKAVIVLCLIVTAIASSIIVSTSALSTWVSKARDFTGTTAYTGGTGKFQPTGGDPIESDTAPG